MKPPVWKAVLTDVQFWIPVIVMCAGMGLLLVVK